jgi:hypothetical protein
VCVYCRSRARAESIGSQDSTDSDSEYRATEVGEEGEESSQWETEQTERSDEEEVRGHAYGKTGLEERAGVKALERVGAKTRERVGAKTWERVGTKTRGPHSKEHPKEHHKEGPTTEKPALKIPLFGPGASRGGGHGEGRGGHARLQSLQGHPSRVDPQEKGLSRIEQFRAEMVRAIYDSEGTSAAEAKKNSQKYSRVTLFSVYTRALTFENTA